MRKAQFKALNQSASTMSKTFTVSEVAKHKSEADGMFIIIHDASYNVTGGVIQLKGAKVKT